ncbi:MAG: heparinase II/III family protein [Victivallales bacterium]|nr:heparinase II/III family protein [Victivallales bacterium]
MKLTFLLFLSSLICAANTVELKPGVNQLPTLELPDGGGFDIYGVEWEIKGDGKSLVTARGYASVDPVGESITFDGRFGHYTRIAIPEWQSQKVEFMSKKDWKSVKLILGLSRGGKAEIRNLRLVKGGFKPNAIAPPAPYIGWIDSLIPNMQYAREMSTPHPAVKNRNRFQALVEPYMKIPIEQLLAYVPEYSFLWKKNRHYKFSWDISRPDEIIDEKGTAFDFQKAFPENGHIEVTGIGGKIYRIAYHESSSPDPDNKLFDGNRIYLGRFMETARFIKLSEVARALAELYRMNGNEEYALRSASLFIALWKNADNWPIFGRGADFNVKPARFHEPDSYEYWFAFILGAGDWYIPQTSSIRLPARNFAMLKNAPEKIWNEAGKLNHVDNPQIAMAGKILALTRQSLLRDAFQRRRPWILYHNTIGGQLQTFVEVAQSIGCPELIHYAFDKYGYASASVLMADGMFPESTSYFMELFEGGFGGVLQRLKNYSDPKGFIDVRDRRFDKFDPEAGSPPVVCRALRLLDRLAFPDGSAYVINDTFAASAPFSRFSYRQNNEHYARKNNDSLLIPDFGYSSQGWGTQPDQVEVHLNYSASGNHAHNDLLNFTLWAYGDEIVSDIGYTRFNNYPVDTLSHNLVVVDSEIQSGRTRGNLTLWSDPAPDAVKFQQAEQSSSDPAYAQASCYRRTLISLPFSPGKAAVIDVFEVKGGNGMTGWHRVAPITRRI